MTKAIKVSDQGLVPEAPKGDREARWQKFLENYAQKNPVKYASKRAKTYTEVVNGEEVTRPKEDEFAKIPASFK